MDRLKRLLVAMVMMLPVACIAMDCDKAIATPDINACAYADYQKADAALNAMYKRVLDAYKDGQGEAGSYSTRADLVKAQRAWVQFRDANCNAVYDRWQQGTIRGLMANACLKELTEQRTAQLESQFLRSPDEPRNGP